MLRIALALWLLLGGYASAQVITVRSGQHDGFVRLVLTFPEPAGWDLGRTDDGYGFRARKAAWRYDVSTVFNMIPQDRLSALWVDPESGVLRLGLGCACHAIATPFRPGIIVVDILDGPAPAGSPYESALAEAGRAVPSLVARKTLRPRQRPAGLVPEPEVPASLPDLMAQGKAAVPAFFPPLLVPSPDPRAEAMRDQLLRDLSRGIAAGAIKQVAQLPAPEQPDPALPPAAPLAVPESKREAPTQLRIRPVGTLPDLTLTASGQPCIADDRLDLAAWGDGRLPTDQLASAQSKLLGEFDRPVRDQLIGLVRLHLHLGFGAEARSLIRLWGRDDPEAAVLDALGSLVDGASGATTFEGMQGCDTAAAMWSVLAQARIAPGRELNRAAIIRAFSALPLGLRRHLGPALSEMFLAAGHADSARAVRDAIDRAQGPHGDGVDMMDARLDLAAGQQAAAERKLETIVADDGAAAAQALATLIETKLQRGETPDPSQVIALEAMMRERTSAAEAVSLRQAVAKGLVVTGEADRAFRELALKDPALYPDLWELLAKRGDPLDLAALALAPPGPPLTELPGPVRLVVSEGLRTSGFAEGARRWADGVTSKEADLLMARVALDLRDGREALRRVAGLEGAEAERLRARSLELLHDLPSAAAAWAAADSPEDAQRVRFRAQQWEGLAPADPALQALLDSRAATSPDGTSAQGPLAEARAILDDSLKARDGVAAVLAARPVPGG
ncbi:MAG: hypothetical protein Q8K20_07525 [Gemmobacter sp.]|nr:hypothetical protein [Gemmobacter sp.]